jgi:hypothetical protein
MHRLYADMVIRFFRFKSCHAELDSASSIISSRSAFRAAKGGNKPDKYFILDK